MIMLKLHLIDSLSICYTANIATNTLTNRTVKPTSRGPSALANILVQYGGCLPFWICVANFGMTHNENLQVVFVTVKHFVAIALVVLIIQKFEYFARLS